MFQPLASAPNNAFVTLLTSDHYLPGALVLAQSLCLAHGLPKDGRSTPPGTDALRSGSRKRFDIVVLITPETLSVQTVKALRRSGLFDWIVGVEQIGFRQLLATQTDSPDGGLEANDTLRKMEKNLALLGRPDLQDTLTKLHIWRIGRDSAASLHSSTTSASGTGTWQGYEKVVFLDADMLVLRPLDHLFALREDPKFAASPDTGWPDAFNSGFMLLKPSTATFESIRKFAKQRSSWDGADQGLLNDYFGAEADEDQPLTPSESAPVGGWKRLSFRYNVTSHGGYTFAPAYQRYGTSIMASHFIGQNKPWNRPRPAASAEPNPHLSEQPRDGRSTIDPSQPDYLLALWHDTYASIYPSSARGTPSSGIEVVHTLRGVEVIEKRAFTVPTYKAVWDAEETLDRERELDSSHQDQSADVPEAQYHSLPLDGRASLIAPRPRTPTPPPSPTPIPRDIQPSQPSHDASQAAGHANLPQHQEASEDLDLPHFSPPHLAWDATRAPPPTGQGAQFYQMRNPIDTFYENAWDGNVRAPRFLAEQRAAFFTPPQHDTSHSRDGRTPAGGPGYIPSSLRRNHVFDNLGSDRPDPSKIKPIFPWEQTRNPGSATRVFPDEPRPVLPPPPRPAPVEATTAKALLSFDGSENRARSGAVSPTLSAISTSSSLRRGLPSNLAYTNAWDEENAIGKFTQWWTKASTRGEGKDVGVQATPHIRHRSAQTGGRPSMANQGTSTAEPGTSMYDTNAEGDAGAQSDSRDGDDESSTDEDDSDDDDDDDAQKRTSPGRNGGSDNCASSRSRGGASWNYQRKAENSPVLQVYATPRSPRTTPRFSHQALAAEPRAASNAGAAGTGSLRAKQKIRPESWGVGSGGGTSPKSVGYTGGVGVQFRPPSYYRRRSQDAGSGGSGGGSGLYHSRSRSVTGTATGNGSGSGGSGTTSPTNLIGLRGTSAKAAPKIPSSFSTTRAHGFGNVPPPIQIRSNGSSIGNRGMRTPTYSEIAPANTGGVDVPFSSSPVNSRAEFDQQSRAHRNAYAPTNDAGRNAFL